MKSFDELYINKCLDAELMNQPAPTIFDHRSINKNKSKTMYFSVEDIECVETIGPNADYTITMKTGQINIFRCSCCITFQKSEGKITLLIG